MEYTVFEVIRPAEALYLMAAQGEEEWSAESALIATLVYFSAEDYITFYEGRSTHRGFFMTDKGKGALIEPSNLRKYEINILKAIEQGRYTGMLEAIEDNDFEKFFLISGIFKKQAPFMGCIPRKTCFFSESGQELVEKLKKNREEISDFVSQYPANVERNLVLASVFPSLAIGVGFEDLINRLTAMRLDLFPPTKATTGFALVIIAILLALIATMEVMNW